MRALFGGTAARLVRIAIWSGVVMAGMEITHEANQLVHITSGVRVLAGEWAGQQWPDPIAASEIGALNRRCRGSSSVRPR